MMQQEGSKRKNTAPRARTVASDKPTNKRKAMAAKKMPPAAARAKTSNNAKAKVTGKSTERRDKIRTTKSSRVSIKWQQGQDRASAVRDMVAAEQSIRDCKGVGVVLVYNDRCHFCQQLFPEWNSAVPDLLETGLNVIEVDSNALQSMPYSQDSLVDAVTHEFVGVPHIVLVKPSEPGSMIPFVYSGKRQRQDIVSWAKNLMLLI